MSATEVQKLEYATAIKKAEANFKLLIADMQKAGHIDAKCAATGLTNLQTARMWLVDGIHYISPPPWETKKE